METTFRFFRRIIYFYKRSSVVSDWRTYIIVNMSLPILQMICYSTIAYYVYGASNISRWLVGNSLLIIAFSAIYNIGLQIEYEKYNGTLSLLIASKTKLWEIFLASGISTIVQSSFSVIIGITSVSFILKIQWSLDKLLYFGFLLVIALFVCMAFGFLFSCFIIVTTEIHLVTNTFYQLLLILTGANFSIDRLPHILQYFSLILPLTRSIKVAQSIMDGGFNNYSLNLMAEEFLLGILYMLLSILSIYNIEKIAIKKGILDIL